MFIMIISCLFQFYGIIQDMKEFEQLLKGPAKTLLIPLAARGRITRSGMGIITDDHAVRILEELGTDMKSLKVRSKTALILSIRAAVIDRLAGECLAGPGAGAVVHLGCGLDSRYERIGRGRGAWYDLDLPGVIAMRGRFFRESDEYRMIGSSVTDLTWMDRIIQTPPLLCIAEGLLMYLREGEVKTLFTAIQDRFPGSRIIFDLFSTLTAAHVHRQGALRRTGSQVCWGLDDTRDICLWGNGMTMKDELFFTNVPELDRLSRSCRLAYRAAGKFRIARNAHRIAVFDL